LSLGYIICVVLNKKDGYPNSAPRAYTASGAIFRTKSAADNTLESMVCFLVAITICDKLANEGAQELIASWAVLVILARTIYPGESYMICRQLIYFFFHYYILMHTCMPSSLACMLQFFTFVIWTFLELSLSG